MCKNIWNQNVVVNNPTGTPTAPAASTETPTVTIISDVRCGASCETDELVSKLREIPTLASAEITQIDYSEESAKKSLESAGITTLPAKLMVQQKRFLINFQMM